MLVLWLIAVLGVALRLVGSSKLLVALPGHPDPNADVLFNMQTRRVEELIFLSKASGRQLVEPYYLFGARNWTWFESSDHNSLATNQVIHEGVLGTISEPLSTFFQLEPVEEVLGEPILKLDEYSSQHHGRLDLIVRFYGGEFPACNPLDLTVAAYGTNFEASKVLCVGRHEIRSVADLLDRIKEYELVGLQYLPPKFVEMRVPQWRETDERWSIRSALQWAEPLIRAAETFIQDNLVNEYGGQGFAAVHWRRGDRAYREEMGIHGVADVALTGVERMVPFVQEISAYTEDVGAIFLATNCGNEEELSFVMENLGARVYRGSGRWQDAAKDAVVEQIIMSKALVVVVPPGVGNPPEVKDTSNFSLFVLEQRRINAAKLGHSLPPYHMCCGTSPVLTWWRPFPSTTIEQGDKIQFRVWGAFLPPGTEAQISLRLGADRIGILPVQAPGDVVVYGLKKGAYNTELGLSWSEDDYEGSESSLFGGLEFSVASDVCSEVVLNDFSRPLIKWNAAPLMTALGVDLQQLFLRSGIAQTVQGRQLEISWHNSIGEDSLANCACSCAAQHSCAAVVAVSDPQVPDSKPQCAVLSAAGSTSNADILREILNPAGREELSSSEEIQAAIKVETAVGLLTDRRARCLNLDYVCMYAS